MGVVTRKVVRQKLLQAAVLDKIEREHLPVNTARVREKVQNIRRHVTGKSLYRCLDEWERIVDDNDIEAVRAVVESDDEHDREMRNLSPLSILLNETERLQVLDILQSSWSE
ncbi:hypothetical protein [Rhodococcus sp. ARC_M6]|uniref:hypothetical protein n=1 Tax=Rhodococcus sp. ARC_M6 TaxID=2928852 RepID=UPI001FB4D1FD|nr:hypothetical protein [Rhodococcus sp. ARC_M6]MCJ0906278.1 hypothetical protein [Rhodococcus sp. ARC_M6]